MIGALASRVFCTTVFLAAVVSPVWSGKQRPSPAYLPDPESKGAPTLEGAVWTGTAGDLSARVELLSDEARLEYVESRAGVSTDPFGTSPGQPVGFLTFRVEIRNTGGNDLIVQPHRCRLVIPHRDVLYPLDLAAMESAYHLLEREMPPAYRKAASVLLQGDTVLAPGQSVSGLLVYRSVPFETRRFRIEVEVADFRGETIGLAFPYRRQRGRERRKGHP